MAFHIQLRLLVVFCVFTLGLCAVSLRHRSTIYVPKSRKPDVYEYDANAAVVGAFDPRTNLYYVGGNNKLSVYNIRSVSKPRFLYETQLIEGSITALKVCGPYVAVAFDNKIYPVDGKVFVYRHYSDEERFLVKQHEITVGTVPRDLVWAGCRRLVVAVGGHIRVQDGEIVDDEGTLAVIDWNDGDLSTPYTMNGIDFQSFNSRAGEYEEKGVRRVFSQSTFSQDLEPERITLDNDLTVAYVTLQTNNALATVSLSNLTVLELHPVGLKNWNEHALDTSDKDGGIHLRPRPVMGMYQPDGIKYLTIGSQEYLLLANEGSVRNLDLVGFQEYRSGLSLVQEGLVDVPPWILSDLQDEAALGRLTFSAVDGKDSGTGKISTLHSYGGRSFSLVQVDRESGNLTTVFESGDSLEKVMSVSSPQVFNSDPGLRNMTPQETLDGRSILRGPEPKVVEEATVNERNFIFVGTENPGVIVVYSLPNSEPLVPILEGLYYEGGLGEPWEYLYEDREETKSRNIGITSLQFVNEIDSPIFQPLLIVIGRRSSSVTIYQVEDFYNKVDEMNPKHRMGADVQPQIFSEMRRDNPSVSGGSGSTIAIVAVGLASIAILLSAATVLISLVLKRRKQNASRGLSSLVLFEN